MRGLSFGITPYLLSSTGAAYYFPKDTGTPPDVFGRSYGKNQRKQRKQRRQNPHLYRKTK